MIVRKRLLCPRQRRRVPPRFSWVDHRLIRENRLEGCAPETWALYLFLVTVADAEGLSYYAEHTLQQRLGLSEERLRTARRQLLRAGLIALCNYLWIRRLLVYSHIFYLSWGGDASLFTFSGTKAMLHGF